MLNISSAEFLAHCFENKIVTNNIMDLFCLRHSQGNLFRYRYRLEGWYFRRYLNMDEIYKEQLHFLSQCLQHALHRLVTFDSFMRVIYHK